MTDRLTCPRCGPAFPLILRSDLLVERRALDGGLGCPNCREVYPITAGAGDLRPPPRGPVPPAALEEPEPRQVEVAHALLGVVEGPGEVALLGKAARFAPALAERIPDMELAAVHPATFSWEEAPGISRMVAGPRLPFADRKFRGVLLEGDGAADYLREAARILAPKHRVVVLDAPQGTPATLMAAGLTVRLDQDGVVVAGR